MADETHMSGNDESLELVGKLARILESGTLQEIDLTIRNDRIGRVDIRLVKAGAVVPSRAAAPDMIMPAQVIGEEPAPGAGGDGQDEPGLVTSEMVGIAYLKSAPDAPAPYVSVGSTVNAGDTLLIIEAMKTMNHIPAPHGGTVSRILVSEQDAVQYGTPLMIIDPS